jgi:hypothetical protein
LVAAGVQVTVVAVSISALYPLIIAAIAGMVNVKLADVAGGCPPLIIWF